MAVTTQQYAATLVSSSGAANPANAFGEPDGSAAELSGILTRLRLGGFDLQDAIGQTPDAVNSITVHLYWSGAAASSGLTVRAFAGATELWAQNSTTNTRNAFTPPETFAWSGGLTWANLADFRVEVGGTTLSANRIHIDAIGVTVNYNPGNEVLPASGFGRSASHGFGGITSQRRSATGAGRSTTSAFGDAVDAASLGGFGITLSSGHGSASLRALAVAMGASLASAFVVPVTRMRAFGEAAVRSSGFAYPFVHVPPLPTAYAGSRSDLAWQVHLVTHDLQPRGELLVVTDSGSHDWTLDAEVPLTWRCQIAPTLADGAPLPNLEGIWARVTYSINGHDRTVLTGPVTSKPSTLTDASHMIQLGGTDPTWVVQQAGFRWNELFGTGTPVVSTVRQLLATYAPTVTATIEAADDTLREPISVDAGSSVLTAINQLLEAAGFTMLAPRPDGTLHSGRWHPGSQRPPQADVRRLHGGRICARGGRGRRLADPTH